MGILPKSGSHSKTPGNNPAHTDPLVDSLVHYDNEGGLLLGVVIGTKKDRYLVLNERNREIELIRARLYILPSKLDSKDESRSGKASALEQLAQDIKSFASSVDIGEVWGFVKDTPKEYSVTELVELYFGKNTLREHAALRIAIINEKIHFKRDKDGFTPREESTVEELKKAEEIRLEKLRVREKLLDALERRSQDINAPIPEECKEHLRLLELLAADVQHSDPGRYKEANELLNLCSERLGLSDNGHTADRAYTLLEKLHIFSKHTNLSFIRNNIPVEFKKDALDEAALLNSTSRTLPDDLVDMTEVETITIDDATTRDMDDAISFARTRDGYELGIHITAVGSVVSRGTGLDSEARRRATSIYCADRTINMLPDNLSEGVLSLKAGEVREALSCVISLSQALEFQSSRVVRAKIRVDRRMTYNQVDADLEGGDRLLTDLYAIASGFEATRIERGAKAVHKREVVPILETDGQIRLIEIDEQSPARLLVSEMMVQYNQRLAEFAAKNGLPVLYRGQENAAEEESPKDDAPEGPARDFQTRSRLKKSSTGFKPEHHSGLGVDAYIQSSSPIRRYLDLCNQRQFLSYLKSGTPELTEAEFAEIAEDVEGDLQRANVSGRETRRYWLLRYLEQRGKKKPIGATVVRTDLKSPLVELDEIYLTVFLKSTKKVKVGDVLDVVVVSLDPRRDVIRVEG